MSTLPEKLPQLLLFDFGGVLLHLNDPVKTFGIGTSREDFNRIWLSCRAVLQYESGEIGLPEFSRSVVDSLQLPYPAKEFIARFDAWPDRIDETTRTIVQQIPATVECAILSNTNALHWRNQDIARDLASRIQRTFLSFETGLVKPDARAFQHVLDETGCAAGAVLFIDDNPLNVDAAERLGMRARLCPEIRALGDLLRDEGVIGS